jgi:small subunit ribosomal protein S20
LANTKSAQKRIRANAKRHGRNTMYRSRVKTLIRRAEQLIVNGKATSETQVAAVRVACSTLDKAAVKGIIHKNNAARRKSRLMQKFNKVAGASKSA